MYSTKIICLLALGMLPHFRVTLGDQYTFTLPLYVSDFSHYNWYTGANTNHEFLEQFDVLITNMMLNARRVVADNFKQAMDAGSFNLVALDAETNKEACTTINNIWVRDFINDLQLLKLDYINNRYNSASQQLLKQPMEETTFLDVGFDEPFDKMVVYYWSYYLKKCYDDLMHNATQLHTKWSKLKEKINTTPAVVES